MNEPEQIERALQHMSNKIGRPNVYTMISGNLTPKQREIARKRCKIDTREFSSLLDFFKKFHRSYKDIAELDMNPQPINLCGLDDSSESSVKSDTIINNKKHINLY